MSKAPSPANIGAAQEIVTLRIELYDSDPPIWREVAIPVDITLETLHDIVQAAMGWTNSHLWTFTNGSDEFGIPMGGNDWRDKPLIDARKAALRDLLKPRKTRIQYLYDFGDSWEHELIMTARRPSEPGQAYPLLLGGEQNAPPDDCGGIPGFYESLKVLKNPKHPEHKDLKAWFGEYDPATIDAKNIAAELNKIAKRLQRPKKPKSASAT